MTISTITIRFSPLSVSSITPCPCKYSISKRTTSTFEDIINLRIAFSGYEYAHSWSLIYFFMNYKNGQYANAFHKYFDAIKKEGFENVEQHNELFERTFNEKIDVIERQWEDYIPNLK